MLLELPNLHQAAAPMNIFLRSNPAVTAAAVPGTPACLTSFGNGSGTEALPGTLPAGHNSPQRVTRR